MAAINCTDSAVCAELATFVFPKLCLKYKSLLILYTVLCMGTYLVLQ